MIMPNLFRRRLTVITFTILILIFLIFFAKFAIFWTNWPNLKNILEIDKCPMCYGTDFCSNINNSSITFSNKFADIIVSFMNVKNIYNGYYLNKKILFKKLAHDWEVKKFDDQSLCSEQYCQNYSKDYWLGKINKIVMYEAYKLKDFIVCPDVSGVNFLIEPILGQNMCSLPNLWTMFSINAEPVILQLLNEDENVWPVPKYYGACGRAVIVENAGTPLSSYNFKDFYDRLEISIKLLKTAFTFTFQHNLFRFYLTDVTSDNIAINNLRDPVVIDLENIIVLHKSSAIFNGSDANESHHSSEVIPCEGCFAFSTDEICSHYLSDHNIYAFCKLIKDEILSDYKIKIPIIEDGLLECVNPSMAANRFETVNKLFVELEKMLNSKDRSFINDKNLEFR